MSADEEDYEMTWYHPALAPRTINAQDDEIKNLRAEIDRLRAALVQIRGFVTVMGEHNWRDLRLHIERQCDALEQDGNGTPCHEGTTCYNSECARLGCLLDRERKFT